MRLYQVSIDIREGEHEHGASQEIVAPDLDTAVQWGNGFIQDFFGENTQEISNDGWYWDEYEERCARVTSVSQVTQRIVMGTDGQVYQIELSAPEIYGRRGDEQRHREAG